MAERSAKDDFVGLRQRSASDSDIISSTNGAPQSNSKDDINPNSRKTGVSRFLYRLIRPWKWRRRRKPVSKKMEEKATSEYDWSRSAQSRPVALDTSIVPYLLATGHCQLARSYL